MEIKQAISNYLDWKVVRSPRAAVIYKPHLNRLADFVCNNTKAISNKDVVDFNTYLKTICNPPTVAYSCRVLKNFFRYLNAINESDVNPFLIQEPKYARKQRIGVSDEEFKAMCDTLNPWELNDLQKLTVLHMLHDTGIRVAELCDLNIDQMSSTENHTFIANKKNKQMRWIMWSESFHKDILLRWIGSRICLNEANNLFIGLDRSPRERVTTRTIERWVKAIAKKAGIQKNIHPHMFRHAKAHDMKAKGADLKDVQMMLGHVSPFSALMYLNYDKNEMLANAKKYLQSA